MYGGRKQRSQRSQSRQKNEKADPSEFFLLLMFANHAVDATPGHVT